MTDYPIPTLTTPRLELRQLDLSDAADVQASFPEWEIVKFMSTKVPWPYPNDGALQFIRDAAIPAMKSGREWHWSIRLVSKDYRLIGVISLMDSENDNRGFWLSLDHWGQGFMSEACDVVTGFWFGTLQRDVLRAPKSADNVRSRRMSERCGMRLLRTEPREYVCGHGMGEIWEITAKEWQQHKAERGAERKPD